MAKEIKAPGVTDEVRKVADLRPDPRNANRHSESQVAQIVTSIEQFGYIDKIVIRPNGQLVGGEGRLDAIKRLGWDEVAVRVVSGLSEAQYKALGLALNRIPRNSRFDEDVLRELLGEIQTEGENPLNLGFSPAELDKILSEPADLEVKEIETGPVNDEFWISIRGPLKHQAHALKALQEAMKPYQGVTVDQGTIALA
ncbi:MULTISPECIES: ParB/Srx family N-terminal domain-containing protein [unclassified Bradyrhizobium]|uniref:ParB/Srx family N-terminal domain-containing protein n=1 Tax=unclassified Bradyrhizobium TaxID=2631580 RepID=UPI0028E8A201|nr:MULTISPECIES: ParB/Srx family N-terminal domain-containing protein [unclassified Bradyrhizobium]